MEEQSMPLQPDEALHLEKVSPKAEQYLSLSYNAAIIALEGLCAIDKPPDINDPKAIEMLLLSKTAKNVRFAVIGLSLGYYPGAVAVLRSALEALSFAVLFDQDKNQIPEWLKNGVSNIEESDKKKVCNEWNKQAKKARSALFDLESCLDEDNKIKNILNEYVDDANKYMHASLAGLAQEFGIEEEDLVPEPVHILREERECNLYTALALYNLQLRGNGRHLKSLKHDKDEQNKIFIELSGRYDEEQITHLAVFSFYMAHRLLDIVKNFYSISDKDFESNWSEWHKDIKNLK